MYTVLGPCGPGFPGAPCMVNGVCSKGFPKDFIEKTVLPNDGHGYPLYARPYNDRTFQKNGFKFDNRYFIHQIYEFNRKVIKQNHLRNSGISIILTVTDYIID